MGQILVELIKLANLIVTVAKAVASANRVQEVLEMQPSLEIIEEPTQTENTEIEQEKKNEPFIVFDNVSARYNAGGEAALTEILNGIIDGSAEIL